MTGALRQSMLIPILTVVALSTQTGCFIPLAVWPAPEVGSGMELRFYDADGDPLDGGQPYKLTIGANVPAKQFWSLIAYDIDSRSLLIRDDIPAGKDFPSISSYRKLKKNGDGSVDLYLGPKAPKGYEKNFIRTVPGKGYFVIYRLYGALQPYFDQTWKLNDLVKVK